MPASIPADPREARRRRVLRPWQWAFIIYSLALTIGTHWPQLQFGPEFPATDKTLHALAFAALTFLLWRTQWIGSRWIVFIICVAWGLLDEWSQGIPILGRVVTWQDATANVIGATTVAVWLWAMRPIGGEANRMRLRLHTYVWEEVFAKSVTWWMLIGVLVATSAPLAIFWSLLKPSGLTVPMLIAVLSAVTAGGLLLLHRYRIELRRTIRLKPCALCSARCRDAVLDVAGDGTCSTCKAHLHRGQWSEPLPPPMTLQSRMAGRPLLLAIGLIALGFAILQVLPYIYGRLIGAGIGTSWLPQLARDIGTMHPSLIRLIDLGGLLTLIAIATRLYRRDLGRHYDRPWLCARCKHDLRGTPTNQGIGRCGECGCRFVRLEG